MSSRFTSRIRCSRAPSSLGGASGRRWRRLRACSWSERVSRRRRLRQCLIGYRNCGWSSPDQRRCFLSEFICPPSQLPALFNEVFGLVTCARGLLSKFGKLVEIMAGNHKCHFGQCSGEPALIWVNEFYCRANPGRLHRGQPSELKSLRCDPDLDLLIAGNWHDQKHVPPPTAAEEYPKTAEILRGLAAQTRFSKRRNELLTVPKISMGWLPLAERQSEAGLPNPSLPQFVHTGREALTPFD